VIVSELEILRVLGLLARGRDVAGAPAKAEDPGRPPFAPDAARETGGPEDFAPSEDRLGELRSRLDHGEYDIAPADVADKMVGRAICDQVARLLDARTDRLTGR
jgi:hypothetical protein